MESKGERWNNDAALSFRPERALASGLATVAFGLAMSYSGLPMLFFGLPSRGKSKYEYYREIR